MDPLLKQEEKVEQVRGEDEIMALCIVCCSPIKVNCVEVDENKDNLLSRNLNVIFLMRKVLQVPDYLLEENLRECGDPVEWRIKVCEQCAQLTRQAEELHWEMVKIREQLGCVQQLILDKAKAPVDSLSIDKTEEVSWRRKQKIWRKTRDFIKTYDYCASNLTNPFIEGEKRAEYLQSQLSTSNEESPVIKVEVDDLDDDEGPCDLEEEDGDWEPPSPEVDGSEEEADMVATSKRPPSSVPKRSRKRFKYEKVSGGKFKCPSCDKVFVKQRYVHRHEVEKHSNDPQLGPHDPNKQLMKNCHLCSRKYWGQYELSVHLLSRHKEDPQTLKLVEEKGYSLLKCEFPGCGIQKVKQDLMDKHVERMHSSVQDNREKLSKLRKRVPNKFPCQFCSRVFAMKIHLKRHLLILHDNAKEKPFKCDICGVAVSSMEHLTVHLERIHRIWGDHRKKREKKISSGEDKQFKNKICHLCGQKCRSSTAFKNHLVSKHREDPLAKQLIEKGYGIWRCKVRGCSAKYTNKVGVEEHVQLMHGGMEDERGMELTQFCAFCGKGFYVMEALRKHERSMHSKDDEGGCVGGDKRFKCEYCGFETGFQSYLDGHVKRVHRPTKKFGGKVKGEQVVICTVCGLQFWERGKLERHMIIHDEGAEQPHKCEVCGRAYSTHESMWKHKRTVHKIYRRPEDSRIKK